MQVVPSATNHYSSQHPPLDLRNFTEATYLSIPPNLSLRSDFSQLRSQNSSTVKATNSHVSHGEPSRGLQEGKPKSGKAKSGKQSVDQIKNLFLMLQTIQVS